MNHSITIFQNQDYAACNLESNKHNSKRLAGQSIRKMLIVIFATSFSITVFSQQYVYVGDVKYLATPNWQFKTPHTFGPGEGLGVCVAKTKTGGLLMLSVWESFKEDAIGGTITIILIDGSLLTLSDRISKDFVDEHAISVYNITKSAFEKLKILNITKLRFDIRATSGYSTEVGSFTATNKKNDYSFGNEPTEYPTSADITSLDSQDLSEQPDSLNYVTQGIEDAADLPSEYQSLVDNINHYCAIGIKNGKSIRFTADTSGMLVYVRGSTTYKVYLGMVQFHVAPDEESAQENYEIIFSDNFIPSRLIIKGTGVENGVSLNDNPFKLRFDNFIAMSKVELAFEKLKALFVLSHQSF